MTRDMNDIRRDIDSIDKQLHSLLIKRADLAEEIGQIKLRSKDRIIHPDREAALIKKILSSHKGGFARESVVAIWREIIGALSEIQYQKVQGEKIQVAISCPEGPMGYVYLELAKDYFSSIIPMKKAVSPLSVLSMVREGDATFGVLPWPEDGSGDSAWWRHMMDETSLDGLNVVARLPFGNKESLDINPEYRALVIARLPFVASEADHSFLAMSFETDISRSMVVDKAEKEGLKPVGVYNCTCDQNQWNLRLLEVDGFVDNDDKRLHSLHKALGDPHARIVAIGGYPAPALYK